METSKNNRPRRGLARVAFLARLDAIKEEVAAGWTKITIYEKYRSVLGITYSHFTRYMAKYIDTNRSTKAATSAQESENSGLKQDQVLHITKAKPISQPRFEFDPQPRDKDELI